MTITQDLKIGIELGIVMPKDDFNPMCLMNNIAFLKNQKILVPVGGLKLTEILTKVVRQS